MSKIESTVKGLINAVNYKGEFAKESKDKLLEFYLVTNKTRLNSLDLNKVKDHDFKSEIMTGAMRLGKQRDLRKIVTKLERHAYAPELNQLHFKNGKTLKVKADNMDDAILYASIYLSSGEVKRYGYTIT